MIGSSLRSPASIPSRSLALLVLLASLPVACAGPSTSDAAPVDRVVASDRESRPEPAEPQGEETVRARTVVVEPSAMEETVWTTGELRADEAVELRSEEDGRVVSLHFREGQHVQAGELLVKINDEDLRADLRRARVQKQLAQQRERRTKSLLDEKTVSQEIYDEALGELEILEAAIESIEASLRKTEIHAPFSGTVGLRQVSEGSFVTSAQTIATLQSLDPVKLDFSIPEKYAADIRTGESVEFTVAGSARTFEGEVYAREPRIDTETRTVRLRARAPNPRGDLLPGAFAKVRLVLSRNEAALTVPAIALVPGNEITSVWVVENGRATPRPVEIGQRAENRIEITSGLRPGDRVVVSGVQQMRPGLAVENVAEGANP